MAAMLFLLAILLGPPVLVLSVRFLNAILNRRRDSARRRWVCLNCGYDCRATRRRCPECGCEL